MEAKVSVIIPVLNAGDDLEKCLSSVQNQTLKELEIICVDRGSADGSLQRLQEAAMADERIMLIGQTGSYGRAVNAGLTYASGDWIGVLDTDTRAEADAWRRLYDTAVRYELDYCKTDNGSESVDVPHDCVFNPGDDPERFAFATPIGRGLYRREFLEKEGIRCFDDEEAAPGTDRFLIAACVYGERVLYLDSVLFRQRGFADDDMQTEEMRFGTVEGIEREYDSIREDILNTDALREQYEKALVIGKAAAWRRLPLDPSIWMKTEEKDSAQAEAAGDSDGTEDENQALREQLRMSRISREAALEQWGLDREQMEQVQEALEQVQEEALRAEAARQKQAEKVQELTEQLKRQQSDKADLNRALQKSYRETGKLHADRIRREETMRQMEKQLKQAEEELKKAQKQTGTETQQTETRKPETGNEAAPEAKSNKAGHGFRRKRNRN